MLLTALVVALWPFSLHSYPVVKSFPLDLFSVYRVHHNLNRTVIDSMHLRHDFDTHTKLEDVRTEGIPFDHDTSKVWIVRPITKLPSGKAESRIELMIFYVSGRTQQAWPKG